MIDNSSRKQDVTLHFTQCTTYCSLHDAGSERVLQNEESRITLAWRGAKGTIIIDCPSTQCITGSYNLYWIKEQSCFRYMSKPKRIKNCCNKGKLQYLFLSNDSCSILLRSDAFIMCY